MSEDKKPRIKIASKWVQGNQLVMNLEFNYNGEVLKRQSSCSLDVTRNVEQFKAFLEEAYEANRPSTPAVALSELPTEVE